MMERNDEELTSGDTPIIHGVQLAGVGKGVICDDGLRHGAVLLLVGCEAVERGAADGEEIGQRVELGRAVQIAGAGDGGGEGASGQTQSSREGRAGPKGVLDGRVDQLGG